MKTPLLLLALLAGATAGAAQPPVVPPRAAPKSVAIDSVKLEQDLQRLPWRQFRSVVESVPKLKSAVDAYGAFGWQFVEANYRTYRWRKNIDTLSDSQKRDLSARIERARTLR